MLTRALAFYLPQYHPIPENDHWWGAGFTEWTNVAAAKPLFRGHMQPRIPADLGFYDLRVPEARELQAELACSAGIEGFCYWHYWFGGGRRLLERPFDEVLRSGRPDYPFCLAWANQTWTGVWHGAADRILMEQTYPGDKDYRDHFSAVLPAFLDSRYIKVEGKPVFLVYRPRELPDSRQFCDIWRECALDAGLPGIYFVAIVGDGWHRSDTGFDARTPCEPGTMIKKRPISFIEKGVDALLGRDHSTVLTRARNSPARFDYAQVTQAAIGEYSGALPVLPCVVPNWDNTPRCGNAGFLFSDASPDLYQNHLRQAVEFVSNRPTQERFVLIKSWNEWAEGNFLEPDQLFGSQYLDATRAALAVNVQVGPLQ